ncbi:MAG: DMT family transporter [Alphaproteobacteria bacterium]|jgi:drug/metabolite transporter (DMT)-like permease
MQLSDNLRGVMLMCGSMLAFTLNDTLVKAVINDGMPLYQVIALRGIGAAAGLCLIALRQNGRLGLFPRGRDRLWLALRTVGELGATWSFLVALTHMPLANLSAIMQSLPLVVTLVAALLLGEKIGWRRLTAIVVGFVGVMIIIRPGAAAFDQWSVLGLVSVGFVVLRDLATRQFSQALPATTGAIWAAVTVLTMGSLGVVGQGWQPMTLGHLGQIAGAAAFLIVGYLCAIQVMRVGEISVVAPFRYTSLLWAILLGWLLFGSLPDMWTLIGGGITVASGLFILQGQASVRNAG